MIYDNDKDPIRFWRLHVTITNAINTAVLIQTKFRHKTYQQNARQII